MLAGVCAIPMLGQEVSLYVSSQAGDRLAAKPALYFGPLRPAAVPLFQIHTGDMMQQMMGFGAAFSEAGALCLHSLPREQQEQVLRALFDSRQGAGFSAMKTSVGATAFASAGPWYSYDDVPGDVQMKHFSIGRDLGPNGLVPYIRSADQYGRFRLVASMDYPPDWMLDSASTNQDVAGKDYRALARYYLDYVQSYSDQGIDVDDVIPLNEPRNGDTGYTAMTYPEMLNLLKDYVEPLLARSDVRAQVMLGAARTRSDAAQFYPVLADDPGVRKDLRDVAYQGYDFLTGKQNFDKIAAFHQANLDLRLWMTETSAQRGKGKESGKTVPSDRFEDGTFWGDMIVSDIEAGASAWIYDNMILDQNGGPWLVSAAHHDPDKNVQQPVVVIDRETKRIEYTGLYYYLAHFSRFVRPGAVRVLMDGQYPQIRGVAFLSPEPEGGWHWVVELLNDRPTSAEVQVDFELNIIHRSLRLTLPAVSITTCIWKPQPHTVGNLPADYMTPRSAVRAEAGAQLGKGEK
jgi:glucosylceramidase